MILLGLTLTAGPPDAATTNARRDSVTVTGTYEPAPLEEHERAVRSLPARELELLASTLADLLRLDAALDLRERAPGGVQSGLSIRGGTFGQTLVLVNGVRMNDAQSANHNMDIPLPPQSVERIEVLRGSGSAFYGSDAVGGVVNVITRAPEYSSVRLRAAAGNFGVNQERAAWNLLRGPLAQQFSFSRDFSSGFAPNRDYRNLSLAGITRLDARTYRTQIIFAHNDRPFGAERFYGNFPSWERTRTWFASVRQTLGEKTEASVAFRRHTDLFVLYRDRPEVYTNRHAVESWVFSLRRKESLSTNSRLHYGAEGFRDSIASNNLGSHDRAWGAGYAAFDARALRRFSLSAGVRQEIYRNLRGQVTPTVAGGVWLSEHLKLRASLGRAFRLPSYTDLYYHDPANLGSPDLRPEQAWSYDGGLDWRAGSWRGELSLFQRRDRDVIDYVRRSPNDIWRATNIHRLTFSGVEAGAATVIRRRHQIDLRYTALRGASEALGSYESKYVFQYPVHSGLAAWQASLPGGFLARTRVGAIARYNRGAYAVWDVFAGWARRRVQPFVQFTNLTSSRYEEIPGVPNPGRSILGGVEWMFRLH